MKTKETQGEMHLRHKLELGREIDHLRSELQKAKELNVELVDALDSALIDDDGWRKKAKSLIKKSNP